MDKNQVRKDLNRSLYEWGVNGDHKVHSNFREKIIQEGLTMYHEEAHYSTFEHFKHTAVAFPTNYEDAIRRVLEDCLDTKVITGFFDDRCVTREPYYRWYDKRNSSITGCRLKADYKGWSKKQLDPMQPLKEYRKPSPAEFWFHRWIAGDVDAGLGTVYEAILAAHALKNESCFHCKRLNCLRWGGSQGAWLDLICTKCHSTFEVKTKASRDKMTEEFERNSISGGSFRHFWRHQNAIRSTDQKMYLVVLPRSLDVGRSGNQFCPVSCMEIDYVLPCLSSSCFRPPKPPPGLTREEREKYDEVYLESRITVKPLTKKKWFDLPKRDEVIAWRDIYNEVYVHNFGQEEFDRWSIYFGSSDKIDTNAENGSARAPPPTMFVDTPQSGNPNAVASLKTDIEQMKLGHDSCDDWEALFEEE
jgi:transposase-like protein